MRLLGRPSVDGRPLPADRRGCLLAYLAFSGDWMSRDQLASLFWPDSDQAGARRNLRQLLNRTKQLDLAEGLELSSERARWSVKTDLACFREALASEQWLAALELYSGELLLDFSVDAVGFGAWLELERENLQTAYRDAALHGAALLENAGRYEDACRHLGALLEGDPLAEDVLQRYLRSLYLAGRRDSALAAFERFAVLLAEELDMEPLQATTELASTIREAAPLAGHPAVSGREDNLIPLRILRPPRLIGRDATVSAVLNATTPVIFLAGEAGIGKSRLLEELAPGAPVLQCREGLNSVAYHPVVTLIREHLARGGALPELGGYLADITRLVPDIAPGMDTTAPVDPNSRTRLLEALARLLEGLSQESRFQLVVDDLQWSDDATLELVTFLGHRASLRVIGAYRDYEIGDALSEAIRGLRRTGSLTVVELRPLSAAELRELLKQFDGSPGSSAFGGWLYSRTGGNPLFVLETLKSLFEDGRLPGPSSSWQELADAMVEREPDASPVIADVINTRVRRLSESTRRTLEAAAVVGESFDARLLSRICSLTDWTVTEALVEAEDSGLTGGAGFRHDLIRQTIYSDIPASRARLLHGRALDALGALPQPVSNALLARHAQAAGRQEESIRFAVAAGVEALALPAYRSAMVHFRTALEYAPTGDSRALALEGLGDALVQLWRGEEARGFYEQVLEVWADSTAPRRARIKRKLHLALARLSLESEATEALREAREYLEGDRDEGSQEWRFEWIEVLLAETSRQYSANELEGMAANVEVMRPTVESSGSPHQKSRFYSRLGMLHSRLERYMISARTLSFAQKGLDVLRGTGHDQLIANQRFSLGFLSLWHGDRKLAQKHLTAAASFGREREDVTLQMQTLTYLTILYRREGDEAAVEGHATVSLDLAKRCHKVDYHAAALANLAWLEMQRGKDSGAEALARDALRLWQSQNAVRYPFYWLACFPLLRLALGRGDLAGAAEQARMLLEPVQLALPEALGEAVSCGLEAYLAGDRAKSKELFDSALELGLQHGFH